MLTACASVVATGIAIAKKSAPVTHALDLADFLPTAPGAGNARFLISILPLLQLAALCTGRGDHLLELGPSIAPSTDSVVRVKET